MYLFIYLWHVVTPLTDKDAGGVCTRRHTHERKYITFMQMMTLCAPHNKKKKLLTQQLHTHQHRYGREGGEICVACDRYK